METNHSPEVPDNLEQSRNVAQKGFNLFSESELIFYTLRLYVAGNDPKSVRALRALTSLCEENLQGRYELEVINIYEQPERMEDDQVFATPTLLKKQPLPLCRLIGDLSDTEKLRSCLGL